MNEFELALRPILCKLQSDILLIVKNLNDGEVTIVRNNMEITLKYDAESALRDLLKLEGTIVSDTMAELRKRIENVPNESGYDPTDDQERAGERYLHGRGLD